MQNDVVKQGQKPNFFLRIMSRNSAERNLEHGKWASNVCLRENTKKVSYCHDSAKAGTPVVSICEEANSCCGKQVRHLGSSSGKPRSKTNSLLEPVHHTDILLK